MRLLSVIALCLVAAASPGIAQSPPNLPPATIPSTAQFDLPSKITGRTYRIYVTKPLVPPPPQGYGVVYILDADTTFAIAARRTRGAPASTSPAVIVVGIAYPDSSATSVLRTRDMTPYPADAASQAFAGPELKATDYGGADGFHRFMIEELRPAIAAMGPVNLKEQSLIGYSLGGLFALHVMFTHPEAYQRLVIGSPSIWFNNRQVLGEEAAFAAAVRAGRAAPKILITSDAWEQGDGDPGLPPPGPARDDLVSLLNSARMVDNARELAQRLAAVEGPPGYAVKYAVLPEENHNSGSVPAANRAIGFVLQR
jgi:predicted alpha/beta superfamily hydrolase